MFSRYNFASRVGGAMKVYEVPEKSPHDRLFRIGYACVIGIFLLLAIVSVWDPFPWDPLTDKTAHRLGGFALILLGTLFVGSLTVAAMAGEWKLKRQRSVTVSDRKLIQQRNGTIVELPIDEITSVINSRGI
jgi:hypothetical protein